jgi:outer membrane protein OmpA-like peptidoglycan-associated protein
MRLKWAAIFLAMGLLCFLLGPACVTASESEEINRFYSSALAIMKGSTRLTDLVALVEKNPTIAKRCLTVCEQKAKLPGEQTKALAVVVSELHDAVLVAWKPTRGDDDYVRQVLTMAERRTEEDDRIFCLERLTSFCPKASEAWSALGDLYLKQRRCGMARPAYEKAAALTGDEDNRKLLAEATKCQEHDAKQTTIQVSQVQELVARDPTMAPEGIVRKARIGNSVQVRVLFDEWSSQIKPAFLPELKVMGEGLKDALAAHPRVQLVIEGHTDRRGPLQKNMELSKARAEAIRDHLVQTYGINPAQLTTEGYGPTRPYSLDENTAGWALNRRVEFKKLE